MMHKKYSIWQRFILALRDIPDRSVFGMNCPGGCGPVVGDSSSWYCPKCGGSGGSSPQG